MTYSEYLSYFDVRGPDLREEAPLKASRSSPRIVVILAAVLAIVVAAVLVALSYRSGTVDSASGGRVVSASADLRLYSGIPQKGTMLGNPNAPVTIRLYEDFQCPYCGEFGRDTLPELVTRYVKTGKVKLVSEPLAFLGTDSVEAAKAALAAGNRTATGSTTPYSSPTRGGKTAAT